MNSAVCCVCGSNTDLKYISNSDGDLLEKLNLCSTIKIDLNGLYTKHICNKCGIDLDVESKMKQENESHKKDECEEFFKEDELCDDIRIEETPLMPALIYYNELPHPNQGNDAESNGKHKNESHKKDECEEFIKVDELCADIKIEETPLMPALIYYHELPRRDQGKDGESNGKQENESHKKDECEEFIKEDEICANIKIEETQLLPAILDYHKYEPSTVAEQQHVGSSVGVKDKSQLHRCGYCQRLCGNKRGLNVHIAVQHKNVNTIGQNKCQHWECSYSNKSGLVHYITEKEKKDHKAVSEKKTYQHKCAYCDRSYPKKNSLSIHIKRKHEGYEYKCTYCHRTFVHKSKLIHHLRERHKKFEPYACDTCGEHFSQADILETHMKSHEYVEYSTAFICKLCGQMFKAQIPLDYHIKMHMLRKNRVQIIEEKSLNEDDAKTQHKKFRSDIGDNNWRHEFSTSFICDMCEEMFISQSSLETHLEKIHAMKVKHVEKETDKKKGPFRCEHCGKISLIRSAHINHLHKHAKERPYKCNHCNKKYFNQSDMRHHVKVHNDDSLFQCQVCLKRFMTAGHLKLHGLRHEGKYKYRCEVCNKGFFVKQQLMQHGNIHFGRQSYKCSTCEKIFETLIILKRHAVEIHGSPLFSADGETNSNHSLYHCATCKKSYSCASSLKRHVIDRHGSLNISTDNADDEQKDNNKSNPKEDKAMSEEKVFVQLEKTKSGVLDDEDNIAKENDAGEEFINIKQEDEEFLEEHVPQTNKNEMQQNDVQIISRKIVKINKI